MNEDKIIVEGEWKWGDMPISVRIYIPVIAIISVALPIILKYVL